MKVIFRRIFSLIIILSVLFLILGGATLVVSKAVTSSDSNEKVLSRNFYALAEVPQPNNSASTFQEFDASEVEAPPAELLPDDYQSVPYKEVSVTSVSSESATSTFIENTSSTEKAMPAAQIKALRSVVLNITSVINALEAQTASTTSTTYALGN